LHLRSQWIPLDVLGIPDEAVIGKFFCGFKLTVQILVAYNHCIFLFVIFQHFPQFSMNQAEVVEEFPREFFTYSHCLKRVLPNFGGTFVKS